MDGLVLFNRFYQPDIDFEKMEVAPNLTLSMPADMRLPLHWIGILYGKIRANLAATSGIYQAQDVIKLVMAGADVTMLCSALMRHGITHIQRIEMDLAAWLEQHNHNSLRELKGIMSQQNCPDPAHSSGRNTCAAFPVILRCFRCGGEPRAILAASLARLRKFFTIPKARPSLRLFRRRFDRPPLSYPGCVPTPSVVGLRPCLRV